MRANIVFVSALALGCASRPDLAAERRAIFATDSAWLTAAMARNVDSTLTFWTTDGRVINAGQPPLIGRDAIRGMVAGGFATPGFSIIWHTTDVVVAPSGDVAYSFGTNVVTAPGAAGGIDTLRGQGLVVWRKGSDGRWRAAVDMSTPQAP